MGVVYTTIRPRILRVFRHLLSLVTGESRVLFLTANDVCLLLQDVPTRRSLAREGPRHHVHPDGVGQSSQLRADVSGPDHV